LPIEFVCDGEALERYAQFGNAFQSGSLFVRDNGASARALQWIVLGRSNNPGIAAAINGDQGGLGPRQREWLGEAGPPLVDLDAQFSEFWVG
jgi:hypothetical protein